MELDQSQVYLHFINDKMLPTYTINMIYETESDQMDFCI